MYHLFHSPHLSKIAKKLSELLDENKPSDPLKPVEIIVPNRDTAKWISLYLAKENDISANVNYKLPSEWLWQRIRDRHPDLPDLLPSDPGPMSWSIFQLLNDDSVLSSFQALDNWLQDQTGSRDFHIWQLSSEISSVFDQYQVYRPQMLNQWEDSRDKDHDNWQIHLWKLLISHWTKLTGDRLKSNRASLFSELARKGLKHEDSEQQPIYLFNPGLIPSHLSQLLLTTGSYRDIYHFMVISTDFTDDNARDSNVLNHNFGTEQKELLKPVTDYAKMNRDRVKITRLKSFGRAKNNLGEVQKSIIQNKVIPEFEFDDQSIQIRSCHSPLREVEVLHQYLLGKFSIDHSLKPDDILVVTPNLEQYTPFIEAVFGVQEDGLPIIPYHIAGSSGITNRVNAAFSHLLDLIESRFKKEDILEFFHHTAIRDHFQLTESDLDTIKNWFEENRVTWGIDGAHRREYDQPAEDRQTWSQAMRRGWLGQLITDKPGTLTEDLLLYAGISSSEEKDLWAKIHDILTILSQIKANIQTEFTPDEWSAELESWVKQLFSLTPEYEDEINQLLNQCQQIIRGMKTGGLNSRISYKIFKSSLDKIAGEHSGGSISFTRGMTFSSMVPARSLPFRVIAILGLNDDQFPRKPTSPEFDVMASDHQAGERDRKNEDRNLFLETILAAGEIHYSSYIGRNQEDDEILPPSPTLDEWIQLLAGCYQTEVEQLIQTQTLNGFSVSLFIKGNEKSFSESYQYIVKQLYNPSDLKGILIDKSIELTHESDYRFIGIEDLERFYRNPVGAFFNNRLNIYLKNFEEDSEEFELDGLETHILFRHVFDWRLQEMDRKEIANLLLSSGYLPEGWPGRKKVSGTIELVDTTIGDLKENGFRPKLVNHQVNIQPDNFTIDGEISSYSESGLLDIYLSGESGKRMLSSWIRHLIMCASLNDPDFKSTILFGIKKGKLNWKRFSFIPNAEKLLIQFIGIYLEGMQKPENLYINSSYQYALYADEDKYKAEYRARNEWGGNFKMFPENSDKYLELILGKNAEADMKKISSIAELIFKPMLESAEEGL
jgi:exodeoxyribonuclease V gamma subunit